MIREAEEAAVKKTRPPTRSQARSSDVSSAGMTWKPGSSWPSTKEVAASKAGRDAPADSSCNSPRTQNHQEILPDSLNHTGGAETKEPWPVDSAEASGSLKTTASSCLIRFSGGDRVSLAVWAPLRLFYISHPAVDGPARASRPDFLGSHSVPKYLGTYRPPSTPW